MTTTSEHSAAMNAYMRWVIETICAYPGVVVLVRSLRCDNMRRLFFVLGIRKLLGTWSQHVGIGGRRKHHTSIGDAESPKALWTPVQEYLQKIRLGDVEIRLAIPAAYTVELGQAALEVWDQDVCGRRYDWKAIRQLAFVWVKSLFRALHADQFTGVDGWEWAWYCSEGVSHAWTEVLGCDAFGKPDNRCTPRTVEKRIEDGSWIELRPQQCSLNEPIIGAHPCATLPFIAPSYC